jgi:hypothetical protein
MAKLQIVKASTLYPNGKDAPAGHFRVRGPTPNGGNPADGMTIDVSYGGGAFGSIINPLADPHPEWVSRYGNVEGIRFALASFLETYDYLLSGAINNTEAIRRLRVMRGARRLALQPQGDIPGTAKEG